jgi:hypothetical protein
VHPLINRRARFWLKAADDLSDQKVYERFIDVWIAFNQLYNYHCYDMHSDCQLKQKIADDLMPRGLGSDPPTDSLCCGRGRNGNGQPAEWGRLVCVVRFISDEDRERILDAEQVDYFLNRKAYSPSKSDWNAKSCGVLNIHRTITRSPDNPRYTIGFINTLTQYRESGTNTPQAIQQLAYLLYTIRCNLMHGSKSYASENSQEVVAKALPLLRGIVDSLLTIPCNQFPTANCNW